MNNYRPEDHLTPRESALYVALEEARYRRKSPCEHGIVQHDVHGDPLPCAFPGCPCGIPGHDLERYVKPAVGSYQEWITAQRSMSPAVNYALRRRFIRETVFGVPRFPRGLFLWVDESELSRELHREATRRRLAEKYTPPPTLRSMALGAVYRGLDTLLRALFLERSWPKRRA
jgi:hypothetical protein